MFKIPQEQTQSEPVTYLFIFCFVVLYCQPIAFSNYNKCPKISNTWNCWILSECCWICHTEQLLKLYQLSWMSLKLRKKNQSPVFQSIVSLTSSLMTNLLTTVAKVFSHTLYIDIFSAKNISVFAIFQDRNFKAMLANNSLSLSF